MANIDINFNGLTKLRDWWNVVKTNFTNINNQLINHTAGTADKHAAEHITYSGNASGSTVKEALDNTDTRIDNLVITGTDHDPFVTDALIDAEGENFGPAPGNETYLNGRLTKWEQKTISHLADILNKRSKHHILTPFDFGAVGDKITDDTIALQAAFDGAANSILDMRGGQYLIKGQLTIKYPITIIAHQEDGAIYYDSSIDNNTDIIVISPVDADTRGYFIKGLWVWPNSGTPGRDALRIVTSASQFIQGVIIKYCDIRALGGGYGINIVNSDNPNGLALSWIVKNTVYGGIKGIKMGDSVCIEKNNIKGNNIGIDMTMVNDIYGSSSQLSIVENNIVNNGGAIKLANCKIFSIIRNNIEQNAELYNGFVIDISDSIADEKVSVIEHNKISPTSPASRCGGIRLSNVKGIVLDKNYIGSSAILDESFNVLGSNDCVRVEGSTNIKILSTNVLYIDRACRGIYIDNTSSDVSIGPPTITSYSSEKTDIVDEGVGTIGILRTITGGWATAGTQMPLSCIKDINGLVTLFGGNLKPNPYVTTIPSGTLICTLPPGFRPAKTCYFEAYWEDTGGNLNHIRLRAGTDGNITTIGGMNNFLSLFLDGFKIFAGAIV